MTKLRELTRRLESEIKKNLESTRFMTNVKFHEKNHYFSMEYKIFNHQGIRSIIANCCKETLEKIMQNNPEIVDIEYDEKIGRIQVRKLILDPQHKHNKIQIGYEILCGLKKEINQYFLKHGDEINKYKKLVDKRCPLGHL